MGPSQVYSYGARSRVAAFASPAQSSSPVERLDSDASPIDSSPWISINSSTMSLGDMRLGRHSTYTGVADWAYPTFDIFRRRLAWRPGLRRSTIR